MPRGGRFSGVHWWPDLGVHRGWGRQRGSIYLADQKLSIRVPRVRDQRAGHEVPLATYATLQTPRAQDGGLYARVLDGLSTREYEAAAEAVPEAFGLAKSSVSRRFIRASARALQQLHERRHDDAAWLVLLLDGNTFAADQLVIVLGVTTTGEKRVLGLVQTATENKRVCAAFLRELQERWVRAPQGMLVVLDGAKGLRAAVRDVYGDDVAVQRCQWHKRGKRRQLLDQSLAARLASQAEGGVRAPDAPGRTAGVAALGRELAPINGSAARSLDEGLEETLTLHRLGVYPELGISFKTTNLIENVMLQLARKTYRVSCWRTSDQKLRWCAATLLQSSHGFVA